jgi:hypothetical protein
MLTEGRLSGSQTLDKGKEVWRVHMTKEILQRMNAVESPDFVVEAEEVKGSEFISNSNQAASEFQSVENSSQQTEQKSQSSQEEQSQEHTKTLAESVWSEIETKFIERLTFQSEEIGRLKSKLEESSGRLLLLEDRERQLEEVPKIKEEAAQAKQAFEAKAFELEAARKQLLIAQQEKESAIRAATDASIAKEMLNREMEILKSQKETEEAARKDEVATMSATLEELRRPWWSKMKIFGGGQGGKDPGK